MASAEVGGAAAMSDEDIGRALIANDVAGLGAPRTYGERCASYGALARKLCAQPAPSSLPAGLVVRPHRVVAGGWGSEPTAAFYLRAESGLTSGPCEVGDWKGHDAYGGLLSASKRSSMDTVLTLHGENITGWCHAEDFQRAMVTGTPVPWVTRTAPRVEWLPWTDAMPDGHWFVMNSRGYRWHCACDSTPAGLAESEVVAYWPDPNAGLLDRLTAAILAGEVRA